MDCVFRALLADPDHADRLLDFLNAVLQRPSPVAAVQLRNPIQPSEFIEDGHIVVDVIATDTTGEVFQVEMQSWNQAALRERMLYAWATLYKAQLERGDPYTELRPVVSIWLLDHNVFRDAKSFHHCFRVRDEAGALELSPHLELHVLELERWRQHPDPTARPGLVGWMRFFTEAETWTKVPREIDTPVLESAMSVLSDFQTNAARNDLYRSRLDYLRSQNTMLVSLAQAQAEKEQAEAATARAQAETARAQAETAQAEAATARAEAATAQAQAEREEALARAARLRERLRAAGIDPDQD